MSKLRGIATATLLVAATACFRGKLPAREFYRIATPDSLVAPRAAVAPLSGAVAIRSYDTPGIYGGDLIVYRVGANQYGAYPSREWAIPLGEMLGTVTERVLRETRLTSGRVVFNPPLAGDEAYEWRGTVRQFDEVDQPGSVSASVSLGAQLVRASDDSVMWSGEASIVEPVRESRSMESVVAALSVAATKAVARLADDASATLRRLAASGARDR